MLKDPRFRKDDGTCKKDGGKGGIVHYVHPSRCSGPPDGVRFANASRANPLLGFFIPPY